jgi:thiosulfate dehydrogenase [quinone] large subunit
MQSQGNKQSHSKKQPLPAGQHRQAPPASPSRAAPGTPVPPAGTIYSQPYNESASPSPSSASRLRLGERILLPLRLFLGVTFVYAGIQKLTDPQFFNPKATGYIGRQILAFATNTPLHSLLLQVALPHAKFFGLVIALGEIAIGLGTLFGFLLRPAAFFGFLLSLMFFLSASWHTYPYFYGSDIVFVFAWITLLLAGPLRSGMPTLDGLLVPLLLADLSPQTQRWAARLSSFFLGMGSAPETDQTAPVPAISTSTVRGYQQGMNPGMAYQQRSSQPPSYRARMAAQQRSLENRRNFLVGLVVGGLGMLGIVLVGKVAGVGSDTATQTGTGSTSSGTTSSSGSTTSSTPSASGVIAQESAVAPNSAVTFTIPSNGDPGVLIHLKNGKFVCYDATCTHAGCPVQFDPGSSLLICPCHGAEFDPANNASVVQGPAQTPLTSVPININNSTGAITLQQ